MNDQQGPAGGSNGTLPETAARLRELDAALQQEQQERLRLVRTCEDAKKLVHTLNNALSIITAFVAVMREELGTGEPMRESLEEIARAAKRAAEVARQLQDLKA